MTHKTVLEDEVWGREVAYWGYARAGDLTGFAALWHQVGIGWPNGQPAPVENSRIPQMAAGRFGSIDLASYAVELTRMSVHVIGDIGITFYKAHTHGRMKAGAEFSTAERLTHTWLRTENGWQIIGGMSAPLTGE